MANSSVSLIVAGLFVFLTPCFAPAQVELPNPEEMWKVKPSAHQLIDRGRSRQGNTSGGKSGGCDSCGTGQGVYDNNRYNRKKLRYLDLISEADLKTMALTPDIARLIFAGHNCTDHAWKMIENTPFGEAVPAYKNMLRAMFYASANKSESSIAKKAIVGIHFKVTEFVIPQIRHNPRLGAEFQIPLAIYHQNSIYLQAQALRHMPKRDISALLLKETVRWLVANLALNISETQIEQVVKLIASGDGVGYSRTPFAAALYYLPDINVTEEKIFAEINQVADTLMFQPLTEEERVTVSARQTQLQWQIGWIREYTARNQPSNDENKNRSLRAAEHLVTKMIPAEAVVGQPGAQKWFISNGQPAPAGQCH